MNDVIPYNRWHHMISWFFFRKVPETFWILLSENFWSVCKKNYENILRFFHISNQEYSNNTYWASKNVPNTFQWINIKNKNGAIWLLKDHLLINSNGKITGKHWVRNEIKKFTCITCSYMNLCILLIAFRSRMYGKSK